MIEQENISQITAEQSADSFFFLKLKPMLNFMRTQQFSFWMICLYLFFEYSRPQSIFPVIDFLPWTRLFLIGALIGAFMDGSVGWVSSRANILLILFAIAILLSILLACYPEISRKKYFDFYGWLVICFLIIAIVNTRERFYIFQMVFVVSALKIAIGTSFNWAKRGFSFTDWGLQGPPGFFCNSGELTILMLTLFPIGLLLLSYKKARIRLIEKVLLIACFCCPLLTILGASSRGSQIAMVVTLIIMFRKNVLKFKYIILIVALVFIGYKLLPEEQKSRFSSMGEDKTSIQRKLYWKHGYEMIVAHPLLGVGFYNFQPYYQDHYAYDLVFKAAQVPHNIFIQVGTDAGFMGLIPFCLLLLYALITPIVYNRRYGKNGKDLIVLCMVGAGYGIFGFIIAGQFVTVAYYPFLWIGLAFIVSAKNILQKEQALLYLQQNQVQSE
jgi:putative inorganic carbon (hco3(-)) transporter